ncbi:carbohydrate porin [Rariglobus hedericola]|uniref:Carbohydrate porin n=1 Tax=Rariglobus hedericola TaxID=2597822 RepID=A0A556QRD9_9BACT|nr:carbohydrate porin [Rariglobus hedericola]TSJ79206.1 carbohydrate porin [Rariglobus hedericola]
MKTKLLLSLLASSAALMAADSTPDARFADRLTGDWGGARSQFADEGVDVFAYYNAIVASNVSGGIRSETNFAGDLFTGVKLDLEKLIGWTDTTFTLSGINRHGSDITPSVGSQYSVMQLVGGQTTFLYNVTLEKLFKDGDLSVKFGRMTATDDFVGSSLYSYSLNNAVNGQIRAVLFDGVMTSYPFAVWGGRVKAKTSDDSFVQVGVFQISPDMFDPSKRGLDMSIASDDGVSVFTQFDWNPELAGRPAHFFVGMNNTFLMDLPQFNTAGTTDHFTRFYAHGDYQVYREAGTTDEGLTLFATFAYTSQDKVAIIPVQSTLGANYKGLLPGRPDDRTVAFVTYGGFSDAFSNQVVAGGGSPVDYEMVFEVGHRVQLTKFAYIQPDIQFIKRPGGSGNIDDAVVLGVQFGASF